MSRYINADRLKKVLEKTWKGSSPDLSDMLHKINRQPTVDAVEVVRCRDCKHYVLNTFGIKFCSESRGLTLPYDETFCSYGERKENE